MPLPRHHRPLALAVALLVALWLWLAVAPPTRVEGLDLNNIWRKARDSTINAGVTSLTYLNTANSAMTGGMMGGGGGGGGGEAQPSTPAPVAVAAAPPPQPQQPPPYVPSFVGRVWDGADWSCPVGTVETGSADNSKACMSGQFAAPVWKQGGDGKWGHNCPAGTTPTPETQWEKKCEVGWMGRIMVNGAWKCPDGTADSGADWNKGLSWHDAQKQCKRSSAYTRRVQGTGGAWVCPPGTTDTKRTWGQPNGGNQCKWTGP